MKNNKIIIALLLALGLSGCSSDYFDTYPTDQIGQETLFKTTSQAWGNINGIHRKLYSQWESSQDMGGLGGYLIAIDAMGEDLVFTQGGGNWYSTGVYRWLGHHNDSYRWAQFPWKIFYYTVKNANFIINQIDATEGDEAEKKEIKGQALCYRAWAHFNLVQLYASRYVAGVQNAQLGIPLRLTGDTEPLARASVEDVYKQINLDLDDAINLLDGSVRSDLTHFDKSVAMGLKARVLLTQGQWIPAAQMAAKARVGYKLMNELDYSSGFNTAPTVEKIKASEWMWGSIVKSDQTMYFASYFAFMSYNFNSTNVRSAPKLINSSLYAKLTATDVRKKLWVPSPTASYPELPSSKYARKPLMNIKFKVSDSSSSVGDIVYMRASEMCLIEAEGYARGGDDVNAQIALYNLAFARDSKYTLSVNTGANLIDEIMIQRRAELWGEGFRWLDLKRLNLPLNRTGANHSSDLASIMNVSAGDNKWQWLIPIAEMNANNLLVQNPL